MSAAYLAPIISAYRQSLQPIPPFTWFGSGVSAFDVGAALRLCVVLRQLREMGLQQYQRSERTRKSEASETGVKGKEVEEASLVKCIAITLVVVYGGEAVMNPWLGLSPSFVFSPIVPGLYAALTALVEYLPSVPGMSLKTELPLSVMDGLTRAFLLCNLIPPVVTTHSVPALATSPWTLVMSSLITANGGFFFVNLFSMLHPTGWAVGTPAELQAYGWTTVDLWCAPVTTALFALLTHAQPFWAELHALIMTWSLPYIPTEYHAGLGVSSGIGEKAILVAEAVDPEVARATCAVFLMSLFLTRTVQNFGGLYPKELRGDKKRVIRSSKYPQKPQTPDAAATNDVEVDGRRLKMKTQ